MLFQMKSEGRPGSHGKKGSTESRRLMYVPHTAEPGKACRHAVGFSSISRLACFHDRAGSNHGGTKSSHGVERPRHLSGV